VGAGSNDRAARALDVDACRIHRAHRSSIRGAARRMIELTLGGALALLLVCFIACGMRNTQRMTRERNSQLQRLLSRPFSTRFG